MVIPIVVRSELKAIAFYGPHRSGAAIDSDEASWLSSLAASASAAYDHIDAERMRNENEALRRQLAFLSDPSFARASTAWCDGVEVLTKLLTNYSPLHGLDATGTHSITQEDARNYDILSLTL